MSLKKMKKRDNRNSWWKRRNRWNWTWEYHIWSWRKKWWSLRKEAVEDEKKLGKEGKDEEYEVEGEDY